MTDLSNSEAEPITAPRTGTQGQSTAGTGEPGIGERASETAAVARDQGKQVAAEARDQLSSLADQAKVQLEEQGGAQKERAVSGLRQLGDELERMLSGSPVSDGMTTDLVRQVATRARETASWLDEREPGDLVDELRDLGRRHPGAFLLGALTAGVVAGRVTRGVAQPTIDAHTDTSSSTADVRDRLQQTGSTR